MGSCNCLDPYFDIIVEGDLDITDSFVGLEEWIDNYGNGNIEIRETNYTLNVLDSTLRSGIFACYDSAAGCNSTYYNSKANIRNSTLYYGGFYVYQLSDFNLHNSEIKDTLKITSVNTTVSGSKIHGMTYIDSRTIKITDMAKLHGLEDHPNVFNPSNHVTIHNVTLTDVIDLEPLVPKWESFGFETREVDGHDIAALESLMHELPLHQKKPSTIICHTVKGKGVSFMEGEKGWHGVAPNEEDLNKALNELETKYV